MRRIFVLVTVACALAVGTAVAGVAVELSYDFVTGSKSSGKVSAAIEGVEMGRNVPLAVTGEAAVDLALEVTGVTDDGIATLRATFGTVDATLLGEKQEPMSPAPMHLRVDRRGALVGVDSGDGAQMDLFGSGGVPLELVVLMAGVVEMPAEPVEMGERWVIERCQQVPQVGEITLRTESRVTSVTDQNLTVLTDIRASLPDFTTANPIQAGEITIKNGVLTIAGMKRIVDSQTGLIKSAEAEMIFDGGAAIGPFPALPLRVVSSFRIAPAGASQVAPEGVQDAG